MRERVCRQVTVSIKIEVVVRTHAIIWASLTPAELKLHSTHSDVLLGGLDGLLLVLLLFDAAVDLDSELGAVHCGDEPGGLGEEVAHLLEGPLGRLGEDGPEEDCIGEVADLQHVSKDHSARA